MNSSYVSKSKLNISSEGNNNERMVKLADKLSQITNQIQNEKSNKFDQYEQKSMNLYNTIEANLRSLPQQGISAGLAKILLTKASLTQLTLGFVSNRSIR